MTTITDWITNNYIELFGAVTGILYVFLEIRQNIWLWPVGIATSAVYIYVFFTGKLYADMSLQVYYLAISCLGWYWWVRGTGLRAQGKEGGGEGEKRRDGEKRREGEKERGGDEPLTVTRISLGLGLALLVAFIVLFGSLWLVLTRLTDSPVPVRDSFITSLSIIATWMLARKIYEHWYLWIIVNTTASLLFFSRGLYPTVILYIVYGIMSLEGLREWKKSMANHEH